MSKIIRTSLCLGVAFAIALVSQSSWATEKLNDILLLKLRNEPVEVSKNEGRTRSERMRQFGQYEISIQDSDIKLSLEETFGIEVLSLDNLNLGGEECQIAFLYGGGNRERGMSIRYYVPDYYDGDMLNRRLIRGRTQVLYLNELMAWYLLSNGGREADYPPPPLWGELNRHCSPDKHPLSSLIDFLESSLLAKQMGSEDLKDPQSAASKALALKLKNLESDKLAMQEQAANEAARKAEERKKRQEDIAAYTRDIKAGRRAIESIRDARIYHEPSDGVKLLYSPLLNPDEKYYEFKVVLDGKESATDLRGVYAKTNYCTIRLDKNTKFTGEDLRINGIITVIGKYVDNDDYMTVGRQKKIMPVFKAVIIHGGYL